jgi:hypothetical protein
MQGVGTVGGRTGKQNTQDNRMHLKYEMKDRIRVSFTFFIPCIKFNYYNSNPKMHTNVLDL